MTYLYSFVICQAERISKDMGNYVLFLFGAIMSEEYITRAEHNEYSKRMEKEHEGQNARISALEKAVESIQQITINVERLAISMENMTKELERQGKRLDTIEETPKKRWETIVAAILAGIVGFALNAIITGAIK